ARRALRRAVGGARRVIAVSAALRVEMVDELGLAPQRIALVPNAADHLPLLPRAPGAAAPILCVAHLEPRKNQALLLRALAADPDLPALQLAGAAKGGEERRLKRLARELGVVARVAFLGRVGDAELARLYASCGCVVLPSLVEGYGIPLAEALRAGAPVALANLPALLEVARGAGASFDPRDALGCARALKRALAQRTVEEAPRDGWADSARALVEAWESAILSPP
ncbi:MAG: glycosyltransferase family 4 protein, partial [Planctomycetes bacterium]|nr:glycosyltransferase family 4 protein [Planctomycetota bacterium]